MLFYRNCRKITNICIILFRCLTDYVDISTITASDVKELVGRYCGSKIDSPLLSMHPKAEIIFRSNHIINHRGFYGMYEFRDEGELLLLITLLTDKLCCRIIF